MKVYVLMIKKFFVSRGCDYASPTGKDDILIFKSLKNAEIVRSERFEDAKGIAGDNFLKEEIHTKKDWNFITLHLKNGSRIVYEIFETDLISSLL